MFSSKKRVSYFLLVFLLLVITCLLKPVRLFTGQKIFDWQRRLKKDLNGCELKNEKETSELKAKIVSLEEENRQQKRLLSAPLPKDWQFLPAKVIGVGGEVLTISVGKKDGVELGMAAVSEKTYLGKVKKLAEKTAEIHLLSFFEEKNAVSIFSENEKSIVGRGLLTGEGNGKMKIEQVLLSENVKKGDLVMSNVEGSDLLVGQTEDVVERKGEMFKSVTVKRLFNPEELGTIFLVQGKI